MTDERAQLVAAGYDAMIDTWESWKAQITDDTRQEWCEELIRRLAPGSAVVELGCGGGTEETQRLAGCFRVTGVDLSIEQLTRARRRVPAAAYLHADFTELELEPATVDAVAAFYVLNHVPRELLASLFVRVHGWLRTGGLLLTTLGASDIEGWTGDFLGAPSYFSSFRPVTNTRLVVEAGFDVLRDELATIQEPDGPVTFQWILARK